MLMVSLSYLTLHLLVPLISLDVLYSLKYKVRSSHNKNITAILTRPGKHSEWSLSLQEVINLKVKKWLCERIKTMSHVLYYVSEWVERRDLVMGERPTRPNIGWKLVVGNSSWYEIWNIARSCSPELVSRVGLHSPGEEKQNEREDGSGQDDLHLGVQPLLHLLATPSQCESESNIWECWPSLTPTSDPTATDGCLQQLSLLKADCQCLLTGSI